MNIHYGMTEAEARARTKSQASFEGPLPLCGNGSFHVDVTSDKPSVTCVECRKLLGFKNAKLRDRYEIYATNARQLGWVVKTFDEWLNS